MEQIPPVNISNLVLFGLNSRLELSFFFFPLFLFCLSVNCFSPDLLITDNVALVSSSTQVSTLFLMTVKKIGLIRHLQLAFVGHTYICLLQFALTHFCRMIIICDCFHIDNNSIDWFGTHC